MLDLISLRLDSYTCPNGWTKLGSRSCFKRLNAKKSWHDSLTDCKNLEIDFFVGNDSVQGSLAKITSFQEQIDLSLSLLNEEETWIGLNDISREGFYVWTDATPLIYVNWDLSDSREKSSLRKDHDCVAATRSSWKTMLCTDKKASVCFIPAFLSMTKSGHCITFTFLLRVCS